MLDNKKINFDNSDEIINDEIDFKLILKFFLRNKIFISAVTFIFFLSSYFVSTRLKKTWAGEFQIVINNKNNSPSININPLLQTFSNINSPKNNLMTEVEILGSPSILMPIFDDVVLYKENKYGIVNKNFSIWKRALDIDLEKNTSILNISYIDNDKDLIISVLNKISSTYQKYSGRSRTRNQELTKSFLNKQINLFKVKSSNSLKAAQEFAIDEDLIYLDNNNNLNNEIDKIEKTSSLLMPNINIENIRVQAANEIRRIELQLEKIAEIGNDFQKLQYIGSTIPALMEEGLPIELANIEKELVERRSKYTEDDFSILRTIEKRNLIIKLLKNRAIGYLKAKKIELQAKMEAAMRPKGVLLKYKELLREAGRDEATLISLENQLRVTELEDSRIQDPWELITMPTLLENAVAPSKKKISLIGLLIGLFSSSFLAFLKEKKSGKAFNERTIEKILNAPLIEKVSLDDFKSNAYKLSFIKDFIDFSSSKKFILIQSELENTFKDLSQNYLIDKKDKITLINSIDSLNDNSKENEIFMFITLNSFTLEQLKFLSKRIKVRNLNLIGFLLLDWGNWYSLLINGIDKNFTPFLTECSNLLILEDKNLPYKNLSFYSH